MSSSEYRHIVRIAGKDIEGSKKLIVALSEIKGIGFNFAQVLLNTLKIDPAIRVGLLSENEVGVIESGIKEPEKYGIPKWFLNRRKDVDSGDTGHVITSDWDITVHNDIEREKGIMSWRGFRHMMGLKVRGQRTRTTGRKGGAVGVKKTGKLLPGALPGAALGAAPAAGTAPAGAPGKEAGAKEAAAGKEGAAKGTAPAAGGAKQAGAPEKEKEKPAKGKEESKPAQEKGGK